VPRGRRHRAPPAVHGVATHQELQDLDHPLHDLTDALALVENEAIRPSTTSRTFSLNRVSREDTCSRRIGQAAGQCSKSADDQPAGRSLRKHVSSLETRFKEKVLDVVLGADRFVPRPGERIGQIVKRVVEILQLLVRRDAVDGPAALDAVALAAQQGLRDIASVPGEAGGRTVAAGLGDAEKGRLDVLPQRSRYSFGRVIPRVGRGGHLAVEAFHQPRQIRLSRTPARSSRAGAPCCESSRARGGLGPERRVVRPPAAETTATASRSADAHVQRPIVHQSASARSGQLAALAVAAPEQVAVSAGCPRRARAGAVSGWSTGASRDLEVGRKRPAAQGRQLAICWWATTRHRATSRVPPTGPPRSSRGREEFALQGHRDLGHFVEQERPSRAAEEALLIDTAPVNAPRTWRTDRSQTSPR